MILNSSKISDCNRNIRTITEAIKLFSVFPEQKSVNQALKYAREALGKDIVLEEIEGSSHIRGVKGISMGIGNDGKHIIYYIEQLNNCWKRFVICKELFHIFMDDPEFENMDIFGHIDETISSTPVVDGESSASTQIEYLAEYAALEYLFPLQDRLLIKQQPKIDYESIAQRYKIPRIFVERYLLDNHLELCGHMMAF